jgi:hypothetical protein
VLFFSLQNNPLFIQSFSDGDDALKFHHVVHCALDVIEEKGGTFSPPFGVATRQFATSMVFSDVHATPVTGGEVFANQDTLADLLYA